MTTLEELNALVPFLQDDADAGLDLVDEGPIVELYHPDAELLTVLDECHFVNWNWHIDGDDSVRTPPRPSSAPPPKRRAIDHLKREVIPGVHCRCRKSRCLKLYCDCYAAGKSCTSTCGCQDCHNFTDAAPRKKEKPCTCKRSHCRTNYCECHAAGRRCTEACRCTGCENCT